MGNIVALDAEKTKSGISKDFTRSEKDFRLTEKIANAIRAAWPRKTTAHVSYLTRTEERTVKFWLAGETRMSVEAVADLLKSDEGYAILQAIMGDSKSKWWLATVAAQNLRASKAVLKREEKRHEMLRAQYSLLEDEQ